MAPFKLTDGNGTAGAPTVRLPPPHVEKESITPAAATAHPALVLGNDVAVNPCVVPDVCAVQFDPPFDVVRIVPDAPTAQQVVVLTQTIPFKAFVVPDVCDDHVVPPFVVARIVPEAPTAQHVEVPTQ